MRQGTRQWLLFLTLIGWGAWSVQPHTAQAEAPVASPGRSVWQDDFASLTPEWKFVGGQEFPGAKGDLELDSTQARSGTSSVRLNADFRDGGVYVGLWRDLEGLKLPDIVEFRVWVQSRNLNQVGVRLVDATGQCHQSKVTLPAAHDGDWREIVFRVAEIVGAEHWGGSNDGKWHGPPMGLGINLGRDSLGSAPKDRGTLWLDDLAAIAVEAGVPTLVSASLTPVSCRPGFGTRMHYVWDAVPLGSNCSVFVHFLNSRGEMVFQADHDPPVSTLDWSGRVEYARTVVVPADLKTGSYEVMIGIWDGRPTERGGGRKPFRAGPGFPEHGENACLIGTLQVAKDAPLPVLPPVSLDLSQYERTFEEDFQEPFSISPWGPGTRWIAHTPYSGDFGDARFADPGSNSPFLVQDGKLRIEARRVKGKWQSGLICSVDAHGDGFAQQFGYFEMRAKLPQGLGTWPAFWLMGVPQLKQPTGQKTISQIEIDVVEQYGINPNALHTTLHRWGPGKFHWAEGDTTVVLGMTDDFHTYGVSVEDELTIFYFDGVEIRRSPTPQEAKVPLYLMVDLALGGGWPIISTPDPSVLVVDHIRVYRRKSTQATSGITGQR